ncbi:hypothetical protein [Ignatzschineria indica]
MKILPFYLERVPGCYLFIGNGTVATEAGAPIGLHHIHYDFNDDITL